MPRYDMRCPECEGVFEIVCAIGEREGQKCETCKVRMSQTFSRRKRMGVEVWETYVDIDIEGPHHPIVIDSKATLKRETESRGLQARRLL